MTKTEALKFIDCTVSEFKDGAHAELTADDYATNVWDTLCENGQREFANEAVEIFYAKAA